MDDLLREMRHLRSAAEKARMAAAEGVLTVSELRRGLTPKAEQTWSGRPPVVY